MYNIFKHIYELSATPFCSCCSPPFPSFELCCSSDQLSSAWLKCKNQRILCMAGLRQKERERERGERVCVCVRECGLCVKACVCVCAYLTDEACDNVLQLASSFILRCCSSVSPLFFSLLLVLIFVCACALCAN